MIYSRSVSKEAKRPSESLPFDLGEAEDEAEITRVLMRLEDRALSHMGRRDRTDIDERRDRHHPPLSRSEPFQGGSSAGGAAEELNIV
ncbi:hypothetical protein [Candidatus Methanocrinis natronophilus]|uniref:Uncharacterized protein n=1 Tax=Candidatus Methanocrinis natronophilus TaxID=3033396 RepID=A0ABT5X631_9EURY|nr:hypothetical protein [Candidatus Methanocrinis natronophilus]MDF0590151.1 hypothetical protein [Candidatus Methanocrinis natronophilus]